MRGISGVSNISKKKFIADLQSEAKLLSAYDVSQRVRQTISCVSLCEFDHELPPEEFRAYMVKWADKPDRTPENPELYVCVIAANQSIGWQNVVWIKEILQIFDANGERTNTKEKLREMLSVRQTTDSNNGESPHVIADKNGFVLALGTAVPKAYREILRDQDFYSRFSNEELEKMLNIPNEFADFVLGKEFESKFDAALAECMG